MVMIMRILLLLLLFGCGKAYGQSICDKKSVKSIMDKGQWISAGESVDGFWWQLYSVTKDEKYLQWMESCFWDVYGKLYDIEENLFYRDPRFFPDCIEDRGRNPSWAGSDQVTANGKKVIWSRGNGWALAGIARILKYLPRDHPSYGRYKLVFKNMAESLKSRQSHFCWRPVKSSSFSRNVNWPYRPDKGTK